MNYNFLSKFKHYKYVFMILPSLIVWFVLSIYPNLEVFPLAFYKWNGASKHKIYVGLQNFTTVFNDPNFNQQVINTVLYVLFLFAVQTLISVLLAMILKKNTPHNKFFRTLFFLPLVFSSVMVGLTWSYMYDPNLGILNQLFVKLGMQGFNGYAWLDDPTRAIFCIVMVHIWANIGYPITIITAGLQTIPETLYEAARVEGCNCVKTFRSITLPLLMPTLLRLTLLTITTGAMAFDYVFLMGSTTGMSSAFDTLSVSIYKRLVSTNNLGMSAAIGVLLGAILFIVFIAQYIVTKRVEDSIN